MRDRQARFAEYQRLYDQGLDDSAIGRQCGVSGSAVSQWRRGRNLPPHHPAGNPRVETRVTKPPGEETRPIAGAPGYSVSAAGTVYSEKTQPAYGLIPKAAAAGPKVSLSIGGRLRYRYVAVLVLEAFVCPRPEGHIVAYADGDRNNCRVENLAWRVGSSRLDPMELVRVWQSALTAHEVAERMGTTYQSVLAAAQRLRAKGVPLKDMAGTKLTEKALADLIALAERGEV